MSTNNRSYKSAIEAENVTEAAQLPASVDAPVNAPEAATMPASNVPDVKLARERLAGVMASFAPSGCKSGATLRRDGTAELWFEHLNRADFDNVTVADLSKRVMLAVQAQDFDVTALDFRRTPTFFIGTLTATFGVMVNSATASATATGRKVDANKGIMIAALAPMGNDAGATIHRNNAVEGWFKHSGRGTVTKVAVTSAIMQAFPGCAIVELRETPTFWLTTITPAQAQTVSAE